MNFARLIVQKGCGSLTMGRIFLHQTRCTEINFSLSTRLYARQKVMEPTTTTTKLETKIQNMEGGALSVPPNYRKSKVGMSTASQLFKKRTHRKKNETAELTAQGFFNVTAFSTAEEYDLESLLVALEQQNLYATKKFFSTDNLGLEQDVLFVTAKYPVGRETRDIFFFREGSVVLWNCNEIESNKVLSFLRPYEKDSYVRTLVKGESEMMPYAYLPEKKVDVEGDLVAETEDSSHAFFHNGKFYLTPGETNFLQKYTFSNAMVTSIKLGIWEATLDRYIDSIEYLTEDLKKGRRIRITRAALLQKTGELFALRHVINLSSDLLDTPDFYWDREELEGLYLQVCAYFSISRRTKVMNEKISHCIELAELIASNLNDAHHIRLEWMIIILIMVEVGFEIVHYMERYYNKETTAVLNNENNEEGQVGVVLPA